MNDLDRNELRLWMNLFLPSVKLLKKVRVGSKVRCRNEAQRTPFERVKAGAEADPQKVAQLELLRQRLDPFRLSRTIERKLERIARVANRRLSPRAGPQTAKPLADGNGKDATLGNPAPRGIPSLPLPQQQKVSDTFPMSRQQWPRLHY